MKANGLFDHLTEAVSDPEVVRGEPAADAGGLEVVVEAVGEGVVFA